jgi:hypothetical protein
VIRRNIYDQLVLWKNKRQGKSAMMIEGARRVGKSLYISLYPVVYGSLPIMPFISIYRQWTCERFRLVRHELDVQPSRFVRSRYMRPQSVQLLHVAAVSAA